MKKQISFGITIAVLAWLVGPGSARAGQEAGKVAQFAVRFGEAGITSLKRVNDAFDTDYIQEGETLGHVRVRYRMPGRP